ncbi:hypothetical protein CYY_009091 [Polysphondylium violaceum]|uniref:Transcription elongation factor SPT5 n=1 Tax=Polysphondylium violaceum TaxID=133409 RepID=A0A8J4V0S2_9MYCE|nr:hypothetical protein CYY_009091 [Polysphondylium violaceum]
MGRSDDDEEYEEEEEEVLDDDNEDYDYEEEEEEERSSKRNKKSSFFDDEVEVANGDDDEDDDEEAEDGWEEMPAEEIARTRDRSIYMDNNNRADADIKDFKNRFVKSYRDHDDDRYDDDEEDYMDDNIPKQSYWRLKCRLGEEKLFIASMMQKMFNNINHPTDKVLIKSIMSPQHLPGHIYVEAEREVHVKTAIKGMSQLLPNAPILTPLKDIIEIISTSKKNVDLKKGTWVRIKLGKYKADIGQIVSYDPSKSRVTVKIIPRIDFAAMTEDKKNKPTNTAANTNEDGTKKKEAPKRKRTRPQARFFNPDEVEKMGLLMTKTATTLHGSFYVLNNEKYKDGFLYKPFRLSSIIVDGVSPSLEELEKFQDREEKVGSDNEDYSRNSRSDASAPLLPKVVPKSTHFSKGDTVKVIEGDLKNLMGIVQTIEDGQVTILPVHDNFKEILYFKPHELQKYFKVGDHVKAIAGRYEGETGLVLRVEDLTIVLLSDLTMSEIKVKPQDLQECTEIATGKLELGNYELHDLVQITPQKVGVIVKVERDSFKILDEGSNVSTVKLQEVGNKRRNKSITTLDAHNNTVTAGDGVEVLDGIYRGKQGTILHISRNSLFIKGRDIYENGGVFVVRTSYCSLLGGSKNKLNNNNNSNGGGYNNNSNGGGRDFNNNRGGGGRGEFSGRGGMGGGGGRGRGRDDGFLHKIVTIKSGPWKGYTGIVRECTETMAQVELQTNSKRLNVQKTNIALPGERPQSQDYSDNNSLYHASRTPMHRSEDPSMTPMRRSNDLWAMRSNESSSSSSSNHWFDDNNSHDYNSTTPGTNYSTYSPYTPNTPSEFSHHHNSGGNNRQDNYSTPYDRNTPMNLNTPSNNFDTPTPGYSSSGYEHSTPQDIPASPFTPHNAPQTPATPSTPANEDQEEEEIEAQFWVGVNIEVIFREGPHQNKHAMVLENTTESTCKVELLDGSKEIVSNVSQNILTLAPPIKKDKVVVVKGKYASYTGTLFVLDKDTNSGIVKVDSNLDFKVFKMTQIAKLLK